MQKTTFKVFTHVKTSNLIWAREVFRTVENVYYEKGRGY
jgi:hypothetical protein